MIAKDSEWWMGMVPGRACFPERLSVLHYKTSCVLCLLWSPWWDISRSCSDFMLDQVGCANSNIKELCFKNIYEWWLLSLVFEFNRAIFDSLSERFVYLHTPTTIESPWIEFESIIWKLADRVISDYKCDISLRWAAMKQKWHSMKYL